MLKRTYLALAAVAWSFGAAPSAFAWNKAGHMFTGAVAYRDLRQSNPAALAKAVALLKKHPDFNSRWKPRLDGVAEEDRDLYLFMLAARWPDDARGTPQDRPKHHFIDYPYVPPGQPASVHGPNPDPDNLVASYKQNSDTLSGTGSDANKAVALAWIFHQVGDAHQPLHAISLFTTDYPTPEGDRGATRFYIRANESARTISLHKLWDDFILGSERFQSVRNRATELATRPDLARDTFAELGTGSIEGWAKESFGLAKSAAYLDGDLQGSKDEHDGEVLPEDYISQVRPAALRRAVLAGYRLSDQLKALFP